MRRLLALSCLALLATPPVLAQAGASQSQMEHDCQRRLRPIVPQDARLAKADFSALGQYANYYVVSLRYTRALETGRPTASCTYRRDGQWVTDDASAFRLARELEPSRRRGQAE